MRHQVSGRGEAGSDRHVPRCRRIPVCTGETSSTPFGLPKWSNLFWDRMIPSSRPPSRRLQMTSDQSTTSGGMDLRSKSLPPFWSRSFPHSLTTNRSFMTFASFQLIYGKLFTFYPIKTVFISSIFIFEVGSLICAVAPVSGPFITGRAIAGMGYAGINAASSSSSLHIYHLRDAYSSSVRIALCIASPRSSLHY